MCWKIVRRIEDADIERQRVRHHHIFAAASAPERDRPVDHSDHFACVVQDGLGCGESGGWSRWCSVNVCKGSHGILAVVRIVVVGRFHGVSRRPTR